MKLIERTVLITGGTSGIGRHLAEQLLTRGNVVVVTGRDQAKLDDVRRALPGLHTIKSDASNPDEIRALHAQISGDFPGLDVLVNNAGIMRNLRLRQDRELTDLTREVTLGVNGPMWMIQQFIGDLLNQPSALIVNVTSGLAFVPLPASPVYCAAKAALHAYTRCLRAQMVGSSVKIAELAPPGTETPLFRAEFEKEMQREKGMDPALVAKRAIEGIEAGKTEIRPGPSNILKIASRLAPALMFKQMVKLSQLDEAAK